MDFSEIKERDSLYIANTYNRFQVAIEKGKGCILIDSYGKQYIDFTAGIGVNIFGIDDTEWKQAVISQLNKIQHTCNLYYTEPQTRLAELLCRKSGARKVFFSNSGAEANECAIKTARKYNADKYGENKRYEIIVVKNSFHGRTIATLSATAQEEFHKYFGPFVDGFKETPADFESFLKCVSPKTGAVMLEIIQGESGVNPLSDEFIRKVGEYCNQNDILLIIDEVQSGNGRTGYLYSYMAYGVKPDIVTTAKGLGGGLPIGACMMFEKTENTLTYGDHGSTFGGNPIVCAGACSIISRLTDEFLLSVKEKGLYIKQKLQTFKNVTEVSGMGLMIGIKSLKHARTVAIECLNKGLFVLTAHDKVRLLPPLNIGFEDIDKGLKILKEVLEA